jgi:hypothetical protein
MGTELRALTVRQPWASAIAYGDKRVENRTWTAPQWLTEFAVHAGSGTDWDAPPEAWAAAGLPPYRRGDRQAAWSASLALGAVVAVAETSGSHPHCRAAAGAPCGADGSEMCSAWAIPAHHHWVVTRVRPLAKPVPCRGMLGLWRLPGDVEKAVREQLEAGS